MLVFEPFFEAINKLVFESFSIDPYFYLQVKPGVWLGFQVVHLCFEVLNESMVFYFG